MKKKILTTSVFIAHVLLPAGAFADVQNVDVTIKDCSSETCLSDTIKAIGNWLLGIAGLVAVVFLVIGGIRYIVSAGNPTQTEGAKKTIIFALVGLAIIVLSLVLINVVLGVLNK
ncbi:MAG: pilin [bacterium]|nr:pilin [bacterium]